MIRNIDGICIDTTFYTERIDFYEDQKGLPSNLIKYYKIFGEIEYNINFIHLLWIHKFWQDAREWYIKTETDRILKEQKKRNEIC